MFMLLEKALIYMLFVIGFSNIQRDIGKLAYSPTLRSLTEYGKSTENAFMLMLVNVDQKVAVNLVWLDRQTVCLF